ncbi:UDP-Gal betaGal beta 1,3-galactosyltransferase, polypeptide 6 [Mortierella claussenii]|nr:UDP-Gal betaGal beta 1,3-galactosyltransferase, polypeptide 6 [Mortierella claussenii]
MPSTPVRPLSNHLVINTHNLSQAHNRGSPRSANANNAMAFKDPHRPPMEKRHSYGPSSLGPGAPSGNSAGGNGFFPGHTHLGHGHARSRQSLALTLLRILAAAPGLAGMIYSLSTASDIDFLDKQQQLQQRLQYRDQSIINKAPLTRSDFLVASIWTVIGAIVASRPVTEPTRPWIFITFGQCLLLLVIVYLPWFKSQMQAAGFPQLSERLTSHALEDGFMGREINGQSATRLLVLPVIIVGLCSWMLIITRGHQGYAQDRSQEGMIQDVIQAPQGLSTSNIAGSFLNEADRQQDSRMVISMIVLSSATPQGYTNRQLFRETTLKLFPSPRNKAVVVKYRFIIGDPAPAVERELKEEYKLMGDLLIVSASDKQDGKSQKLYKAIEWADQFDFDYLVKTDDDVLVRMDTLSGELYKQGKKPYFWKGLVFKNVPNTRLDDMDLKEMPVFTDGTLTTLSRDIVRLLAVPAPRYNVASSAQSLGIWLHGYGVKPQHDTRIQPGAFVCEEDLIAKHFDNEPSLAHVPHDDPIKMVERINLIRAELKENKNNRNFHTSISICDSLIQKRCAMCYSCQGRASNWKLIGFDCKQGGVVVGDKYRKPELLDAKQMDELLNRPSSGIAPELGAVVLKDYRPESRARQQMQSSNQGNSQPLNGVEAGTESEDENQDDNDQQEIGIEGEESLVKQETSSLGESYTETQDEDTLLAQDEEEPLDEAGEPSQEEQDGSDHEHHDESEMPISDQEVDYLDRRHDEDQLPPVIQSKRTQRKKSSSDKATK